MMAPVCDRELNAFTLTLLLYQIPDTLPDITHSHIIYIDTKVIPKIVVPSGEQLMPLISTLVCRGPG